MWWWTRRKYRKLKPEEVPPPYGVDEKTQPVPMTVLVQYPNVHEAGRKRMAELIQHESRILINIDRPYHFETLKYIQDEKQRLADDLGVAQTMLLRP